jgi:hypothetical protein
MITISITVTLLTYLNKVMVYTERVLQVVRFQRRKTIEFNRTVAGGIGTC